MKKFFNKLFVAIACISMLAVNPLQTFAAEVSNKEVNTMSESKELTASISPRSSSLRPGTPPSDT